MKMRSHCNCLEHASPSASGRHHHHVLPIGKRPKRLQLSRVLVPQRESSTAPAPTTKKGKSPSPERGTLLELASPVQEFAQQLIDSISQRMLNTQEQATVLQEAHALEQGRERTVDLPDIKAFLTQVPVWEMKKMRKLCHLTSLTYKMPTVTPRKMKRKHGLDLVTTSWACEIRPYEHAKTAEETMGDGDGMGVSFEDARNAYQSITGGSASGGAPTRPVVYNNVLPGPVSGAQGKPGQGSISGGKESAAAAASAQKGGWLSLSPADMVAAKIAEAASAASTAAVSPLASAASSLYAGLASLPIASALGAGPRSSAPAAAAALMAAATKAAAMEDKAGNAAVAASAVAGTIAIAAAPGSGPRLAPAAPQQSTTSPGLQPSEWFVCDEPSTYTRTFVIQGSDTIDHWRLNLTFDPVVFEDPALGVKVHRGVYEAAAVLFERFLPMVYEHLDSSPFAKVTFTGHSIGGSLGTLLALMYIRRGVLSPSQLSTVYTFGAPAVFCVENEQQLATMPVRTTTQPQVANGTSIKAATTTTSSSNTAASGAKPKATSSPSTTLPSAPATAVPALRHQAGCRCGQHDGPNTGLLASLGLQEHMVRNVIMHRDIVPRAFACDYSLVSDILKSWGPAFKNHHGLAHPGRKHLYYFVGRMMVLQPDGWHSFVAEPDHPMLPPGPDLFLLGPRQAAGISGALPATPLISVPTNSRPTASGSHATASNAKTAASHGSSSPAAAAIKSHGEALFSILDNPHPLDMLADPGAYMATGSISRYHNPDNYTAALGRLIWHKRVAEGGRFPGFVSRAYSRSLRLESEEEAGVPSPVEVSAYDSSDADALAVPPALALLQAAQDLPHW